MKDTPIFKFQKKNTKRLESFSYFEMKSYVNNLCARSAKVETYKSVLSGQPHLPKVETVKICSFKTTTPALIPGQGT